MKKVSWKYYEPLTIADHIKKHIFDLKDEIPYWQKQFIDLDNLKSKYCKTSPKCLSELYKLYDSAAKENVYNHGNASKVKTYIYKGNNGYSCNFSNVFNNLTTCTKISFNNEGKLSRCTILSCFFRNSFSVDSIIFPCLKNMPLKINSREFKEKDFLSNCKSLVTAKYLTYNCTEYNNLDILHKRWLLLFNYLIEQWKHHEKHKDIKFENYSYTYYLMFFLYKNLRRNNGIDFKGILCPSDFDKEKDNVINKIKELKKMVGSLKSEIEYYSGEMSLLLLCYYAMDGDITPYIEDETDEVKENVYMIINGLTI